MDAPAEEEGTDDANVPVENQAEAENEPVESSAHVDDEAISVEPAHDSVKTVTQQDENAQQAKQSPSSSPVKAIVASVHTAPNGLISPFGPILEKAAGAGEASIKIIDPPLGGFDKLPIRSQLRTTKGKDKRGKKHKIEPSSTPNVKDMMQMRQAEVMVNNEMQFQFRGSVTGWKLSPIRGTHKKKLLHGLLPRPSSTQPWMHPAGTPAPESLSSHPSVPEYSAPIHGLSSRLFEGVQGNNVLEPSAVAQHYALMQQKYQERKNMTSNQRRELPPPRPHTSMAIGLDRDKVRRELSGSLNGSRRSWRDPKNSSVKDEKSMWSDFGLWGDDSTAADTSAVPGTEMYLNYVRAKTASVEVSRQSSRVSVRSSQSAQANPSRVQEL